MLAERFILFLEALRRSGDYPDPGVRIVSTAPHVPVALSERK